MTPTRPWVLIAAFVASGALAFSATELWLSRGTPPGVPVAAPFVLLTLAVVALATALSLRSRFRAQREHRVDARPVNPLTAARAAVFAKASSHVAAVIGGVYAGYAVYMIGDLDVEARRLQAVRSAWSAGAAVLLIAAALFLEHVCRVPRDPQDKERDRRPPQR